MQHSFTEKRIMHSMIDMMNVIVSKSGPWRVVHSKGPHYFKSRKEALKYAKEVNGTAEKNEKHGLSVNNNFPEFDTLINTFCKKAVHVIKRNIHDKDTMFRMIQYIIEKVEKQLDKTAEESLNLFKG